MIIKKLNSLFHKHARVLFGAFAIIIIIAFMDFLTPGRSGCAGTNPADIKVGTAFGKDVTYGDLQKISNDIQLFGMLTGQQMRPENRDLFEIYCFVERTAQMGISVSEKEAGDMLKELPFFKKDNKFDVKLYQDFCTKNNVSDNDVISALKFFILQRKLSEVIAGGVKVSDGEVETFYRTTYPVFTVKIKEVKHSDSLKEVKKVTDDQLKKFLAANQSNYMIPAKLDALIIEITNDAFLAEAAKSVSTREIDQIAKQYGNAKDENGKPIDMTKIKADIKKAMIEQKARQLAAEKINKFARKAYAAMEKVTDPAKRAAIFRTLAGNDKFTVIETGLVDFNPAAIAGINSQTFMTDLKNMPVANISRLVQTDKGFAIGYLIKRIPERKQTLAEAKKSTLVNDFKNAEAARISTAKADKYSADIKKAGKNAKAAAIFNAISGKLTELTFSRHDLEGRIASTLKDADKQLAGAVYGEIIKLAPGAYTAPVNVGGGSAIAMLVKRTAADMKHFAAMREQLRQMLTYQKQQAAFYDFQQNISRQCRYDLADREPQK